MLTMIMKNLKMVKLENMVAKKKRNLFSNVNSVVIRFPGLRTTLKIF